MKKHVFCLVAFLLFCGRLVLAQSNADNITLRNLTWNKSAPAGFEELNIPSAGSLLQGFMYTPNGKQKHPTLLMLHGFPGNERNLDLAQVVRAQGWNVIYFDYRGSWGSQGKFSFTNCVEDVVNTVSYCKRNADSLKIDTANIVLFGHSMGGWICLKALQQLPGIKKGFALSSWNIYDDLKNVQNKEMLDMGEKVPGAQISFVLNTSFMPLYEPVINNLTFYNLANDGRTLIGKQIIMLDENTRNKPIAAAIQLTNSSSFEYAVWETDPQFTNKRASLAKKLLAFLAK